MCDLRLYRGEPVTDVCVCVCVCAIAVHIYLGLYLQTDCRVAHTAEHDVLAIILDILCSM